VAPSTRWGATWTAALSLFLLVIGGLEVASRARGFRPSVRDDAATWAAIRRDVARDSVVLVGTSRIQAAIDPGAWAAARNGPAPVQLAVAGDSPLPVLEDLARDDRFTGTLVVEVLPRIWFDARESREQESQRMLAEHARAASSPSLRAESRLRIWLAGHLAQRSLPLRQLLSRLMQRDPRVPYFAMDALRFLRLDFTRVDPERRRRILIEQIGAFRSPETDSQRDRLIDRYLAVETTLLDRGVRVVLVQLPREGKVAEIEQQNFPRARFWDVLVDRSQAVAFDVREEATLSGFHCPDGSHIDVADAPAFTRAFAAVLAARFHPTGATRDSTQKP
jgi:hypothetical protein